jgi:hypothetical protein
MNKKWDLRRVLMVGLGGFWLVDGILQLQPAMFTNAFVNTVLAPNVQNQPYMIGDAVTFGTQLFGAHPVWFNLVAALIQILIGALLVLPLSEAAQRAGLWLSVVWAFVIWIFGEGFGLIVTGNATFYTGAPGSALIYLLIALALLFSFYKKLPLVAGIIFLFGAFLNMLPMFWQPAMLSMLSMTPSVAGALGSVGSAWAIPGNLIAVDLLLGIGVFLVLVPNRTVAWVTIIFLLIVWWLGQGFGGLQTFPWGTATDPNSAPLLILCLAPIFFIEKTPVKP